MISRPLAVKRSLLESDALASWVVHTYDLPRDATCRLLSRETNDTFRIQAREHLSILKVYPRDRRNASRVDAEIELLQRLLADGIRVSKPLATRAGNYREELAAPEGTRQAVLFENTGGAPSRPLSESQSWTIGRTLARIHDVASRLTGLDRPALDLDSLLERPLAAVRDAIPELAVQVQTLENEAGRLRECLKGLPLQQLRRGICHGDLHSGNLHFGGNRELTFIDFDDSGPGWPLYDLGTFLWALHFSEQHPNPEPIATAFLNGYESLLPLSPLERRAVPALSALRHFWVGGLVVRQSFESGLNQLGKERISGYMAFLSHCVGRALASTASSLEQ